MSPKLEYASAGLLALLFVALCISSVFQKSATTDEFAHMPAGLHAWRSGSFELYNKTPPLSRMAASLPALLFKPDISTDLPELGPWRPWDFAHDFQDSNAADYAAMLAACRAVVTFIGLALCLLVWRAARKRYGKIGGLASLAACALSPTMIAHSRLVTTDVPAAFFSFLFMLAVLSYWKKPSFNSAVLTALALGAAVLTKFSCLFWAPFALAAPLLAAFVKPRNKIEKPKMFVFAGHLAMLVLVAWLCIILGYGGRQVKVHNRVTPASSGLRAIWPVLKWAPLPADFVKGLDRQLNDAQQGEFKNDNYILGKSYSGGKWYYFAVAAGVKEPVIYLVLFAAAAGLAVVKKPRRQEETVPLFFIAAFFVTASVFGSLQIGVRYLLPVYPACFLLFGKLGSFAFSADVKDINGSVRSDEGRLYAKRGSRRFLRGALVFALALLLVEHVLIWPHYLAYFNAFVGGPTNGFRVLRDSNLDWGQDLPALAAWMRDNNTDELDLAYCGHDDPQRFGIRYTLPARGSDNRFIAISANYITGNKYPLRYSSTPVNKSDPMWAEIGKYRDRKPVAMPGYSIFVYHKVKSSNGHNRR